MGFNQLKSSEKKISQFLFFLLFYISAHSTLCEGKSIVVYTLNLTKVQRNADDEHQRQLANDVVQNLLRKNYAAARATRKKNAEKTELQLDFYYVF